MVRGKLSQLCNGFGLRRCSGQQTRSPKAFWVHEWSNRCPFDGTASLRPQFGQRVDHTPPPLSGDLPDRKAFRLPDVLSHRRIHGDRGGKQWAASERHNGC